MSQVFLVQFLIQWLFFSKTSKSQAKKQKVAKKARGGDADPYDFESDEEQDTGGKHENNFNDDFVCLSVFVLFLFFIFLSFVCLTFVFIMQTLDYVSGCLEFSQLSSCLNEAMTVNTLRQYRIGTKNLYPSSD